MWGALPIHLLGADIELDRRTRGVAGAAAAAPHSMVQELLNRSDDYLWAILSQRPATAAPARQHQPHPLRLRRVRPGGHVRRPGVHRLRRPVDGLPPEPVRGGTARAVLAGALGRPRAAAGRPGPRHPAGRVRAGHHRPWRRLPRPPRQQRSQRTAPGRPANRRRLPHASYSASSTGWCSSSSPRTATSSTHPATTGQARSLYARYYSAGRIRDQARRHRGGRHGDLWESLKPVFAALGTSEHPRDRNTRARVVPLVSGGLPRPRILTAGQQRPPLRGPPPRLHRTGPGAPPCRFRQPRA